jgi:endonuclease YncB( thermonuclease family)
MEAPKPCYVRRAELVEVHDGDTQIYRLDHGRFPKVRSCDEVPIRVRNLYCAELRTAAGLEARMGAIELLTGAQEIVVETFRSKSGMSFMGSMERTVGDVWIDGKLFAERMVELGFGTPKPAVKV